MKIAVTADWHIHEFQEFSKQIPVIWEATKLRFIESSTGKLMNSRLKHTLDGICDIRDYCQQNQIKHVLNAGDVFHKRGTISVNAFNAAYMVINSFRECGIQLVTIAGNHDQVDASDNPATSIHTFSDISTIIESPAVLTISSPPISAGISASNGSISNNSYGDTFNPIGFEMNTPIKSDIESISILALPYSKNKNYLLSEFHRLIKTINSKESILLTHVGINGGMVGSGMVMVNDDYELSEFMPEEWKYIVLGHFHRPQLLYSNALYAGTPVQNSFSDELPIEEYGGYNGFFVLDTIDTPNIEFIPILQPRFITATSSKDLNDRDYFRIKAEENAIISDSNVRVEIQKEYSQPTRSKISLGDSFEASVKKYVEENCTIQLSSNPTESGLDVLQVGLDILLEARNEVIE